MADPCLKATVRPVRRCVVPTYALVRPQCAVLDESSSGDWASRSVLAAARRTDAAATRKLEKAVERNFFGDESLTDIAESLGVTLSQVSQMRAHALALLHAAMSEVREGQQAFVFGSWAARYCGEPGPVPNDVDVLVVGTADIDLGSAARGDTGDGIRGSCRSAGEQSTGARYRLVTEKSPKIGR